MGFLFYQGNRLLIICVPTIEAAEHIKLNTASAHLWAEEILSGDQSENEEDVWKYLDTADWYVNALLIGGKNQSGTYYPLYDKHEPNNLALIQKKLLQIRSSIEQRFQNKALSSPGSPSDDQFDRLYFEFNSETDLLLNSIKEKFQNDVLKYQVISGLLILASILASGLLYRLLSQKEWDQEKSIHSLTAENKQAEAINKILHIKAHYDFLTGMPNRIHFLEELDKEIEHSQQQQCSVCILFIDLDHFKAVNDQFGHTIGDKLLTLVGSRILKSVRSTDLAARISGDEFIVILKNQRSSSAAIESAKTVSSSLIKTIKSPYHIEEIEIKISASIGIAIYPDDSYSADELISHADQAMYHAKSLGKNNFQFYSQDVDEKFTKKIKRELTRKEAMH